MVEEANGTDDLTGGADFRGGEVGGVPDDHGTLGDLKLPLSGLHVVDVDLNSPSGPIVVKENLLDVGVEHESSSMDGAEPGEALGKPTEAVHGVDVRGLPVSLKGGAVRLKVGKGLDGRLVEVIVVGLQAHCVGDKLVGGVAEPEGGVKLAHGHLGEVLVLEGAGILGVVAVDIHQEGAEAALLEHSHETTAEGLLGGGGYLQHLAASLDKAAIDTLEFKVLGDLGVKEHLGQLTACHDELRDEVDVVITVRTEVGGRISSLEFAVKIR